MPYTHDLEEYADVELHVELDRRRRLRNEGLCSYCLRPLHTATERYPQPCRFHETMIGKEGNEVKVRRNVG